MKGYSILLLILLLIPALVSCTQPSAKARIGIGFGGAAGAPGGLSYNLPPSFVAGMPLASPYAPSVTGIPTTFSASPSFPAGITLNPTTGLISGMPTATAGPTDYVVTASNSLGSTATSVSFSVRSAFPVPYGTVNALHLKNNNLYLGGSFGYVGPYTGSGVFVDKRNGSATSNFLSAIFNGPVHAAIVDPNSADWFYVGGEFTRVGNSNQKYLVRIKNDGTLDGRFSPSLGGAVYALAANATTIYVGGAFNSASGVTRNNLAAFDKTFGALQSWNPDADYFVRALYLDGTTLYVGGEFSELAGAERIGAGAISITDGNLQSWNPGLYSYVRINAITKRGGKFYLGGEFYKDGMQNLAAFDSVGDLDTTFDPNPNGAVYSLALDNGPNQFLFVGGEFDSIGGDVRTGIALYEFSGETVQLSSSFNPDLSAADDFPVVYAMSYVGSSLHIGGNFNAVGGISRLGVAQLSGANATLGSDFNTRVSAIPRVIAYSNETFFIGGDFTSINGVPRNALASFDITTGALSNFNPDVNGAVYAISSDGAKLYFGGDFSMVSSSERISLAATSLASGLLDDSWKPETDGGVVQAIAVCDASVFVGGNFRQLNGSSRRNMGKIHSDGTVLNWGGSGANFTVRTFLCNGSNLYVGGDFTSVNGTIRKRVAQLATSDATDLGFAPAIESGSVYSMALSSGIIYLGGRFDFVQTNVSRRGLAAYSTGGTLQSFRVTDVPIANALVSDGTYLYVAGTARLKRFQLSTGNADASWPYASDTGNLNSVGYALALIPGQVVVGGDSLAQVER